MAEEKTRYTDEELEEFKSLIMEKMAQAEQSYNEYAAQLRECELTIGTPTDTDDGQQNLSKESLAIMAGRMEKYIKNLKNALIRIANKTYGIDRKTGKLIPKERLMAVPHATLTVESKRDNK